MQVFGGEARSYQDISIFTEENIIYAYYNWFDYIGNNNISTNSS